MPSIAQWIVDTRPLWAVDTKLASREQVKELGNVVSINIFSNYSTVQFGALKREENERRAD